MGKAGDTPPLPPTEEADADACRAFRPEEKRQGNGREEREEEEGSIARGAT